MQVIKYDKVSEKNIEIRRQKVIPDSDVAELYQVETKRINEAVSRNTEKFPTGYLLELTKEEWGSLKSQIATSTKGRKVKLPTAFTERGLYMLATILKSPAAIIDTFAKMKDLTQTVYQFSNAKTDEQKVSIFERSTDMIADLLDNELMVSQHETSIKIKLPFLEISRKITKIKK